MKVRALFVVFVGCLVFGCGSAPAPSSMPSPPASVARRTGEISKVLVVLSLNKGGGSEEKRLLKANQWVKEQVVGPCNRLHGPFADLASSSPAVWDELQSSNVSQQQGEAMLAKLASQNGADVVLRIWSVQRENGTKLPFLPIQFRGRNGAILQSSAASSDQSISFGSMEWSENGKGTTVSAFCGRLFQAVELAKRVSVASMEPAPPVVTPPSPAAAEQPLPAVTKATPLQVVIALGAPAPVGGRPLPGLRLADFAEVVWKRARGSAMFSFLPLKTWELAVQRVKNKKSMPKKGKAMPVAWQDVAGQWEGGTRVLALSFYSRPRKFPPKNKRMYFLVATLFNQDKKELQKVEIPLAYSVETPTKKKGAPRLTSVERAAQALGEVDVDSWFPGANAPAPR